MIYILKYSLNINAYVFMEYMNFWVILIVCLFILLILAGCFFIFKSISNCINRQSIKDLSEVRETNDKKDDKIHLT